MNTAPMLCQTDLQSGLEKREFYLLFQPRMDCLTGHTAGAEALVRWRHPKHGVISPAHFIGLAETSSFIHQLGLFVLDQACAALRRWQLFAPGLEVSVNASPHQLTPEFPGQIEDTLIKYGIPPHLLEIEVTEGVLLSKENVWVLTQIMALGVNVAIDDFGTGHSSLSYLRHFKARTLKIDGSFLTDLPGSLTGCMLLGSIIKLGHGLGMSVVCEGVETTDQMELSQLAQADQIQGYAFAKPLTADQLSTFLLDGDVLLKVAV